jgi:drug/metabolite transporter (DMT)-like permease
MLYDEAMLSQPARSGVPPSACTILASSVIRQFTWNYAIERLGATRTMAHTYLQPVVGIAVAAALPGERPHGMPFFGGAVVVLGLVLYTLGSRPTEIARAAG